MEQNQEEFDQKRFLLAMILSGLVLVVWQAFFAPAPPPPTEAPTEVTQTDTAKQQIEEAPPAEPVKTAPADVKPPEVLPVVTHELKTSDFRVVLSSQGARLVEAEVLQPEQYNAEGDLLAEFPDDSPHFPFGLTFVQNSIALHRNLVWAFVPDESKKVDGSYEVVTYRHTDPAGRFTITKQYTVAPKEPYKIVLEVIVANHQSQARITDSLALDIFGYKDPSKESSFLDVRPDEPEAVCMTTEDVERELFSSVENPLTFDEGTVRWGAIDDRYFLFAAAPGADAKKCVFEVTDELYLRTRLVQPEFSVGAGESYRMKYDLFVGPKDFDVLEERGAGLEAAVDYGFWTFLARPFRWLLVLFYGWVQNWGFAIILLTFLIRLILWPINHKVYVNSERMKELQPKLNELREKYKDDQQRQAEETMKLWKEHNVSPLGCLPMVLQFPILLALYFMILNSVELYQADFVLWYTDLSAHDPYFVLPLLMGVVMFAQQSMMTIETPNPQMATMMKIMPVMFTVFMLFLPSGVVLYYFVSLIIGLLQQFLIKRSYAAKKAAAA